MKQTNPKIDTYIAKASDFANPILFHLRELIHEACPEVDEEIVKKKAPSKKEQVSDEVPAFFLERLNKNPKAKKVFVCKSPSFRKEYAKWLNNAKTDATREKRAAESIEWAGSGNIRNDTSR